MNLTTLALVTFSTALIHELLSLIGLDINSKQFLVSLAGRFLLDSFKHYILHTYSSRQFYCNIYSLKLQLHIIRKK